MIIISRAPAPHICLMSGCEFDSIKQSSENASRYARDHPNCDCDCMYCIDCHHQCPKQRRFIHPIHTMSLRLSHRTHQNRARAGNSLRSDEWNKIARMCTTPPATLYRNSWAKRFVVYFKDFSFVGISSRVREFRCHAYHSNTLHLISSLYLDRHTFSRRRVVFAGAHILRRKPIPDAMCAVLSSQARSILILIFLFWLFPSSSSVAAAAAAAIFHKLCVAITTQFVCASETIHFGVFCSIDRECNATTNGWGTHCAISLRVVCDG